MSDDQDTFEEKTKHIEKAVEVSTSRNAVDVDVIVVHVDGKSLDEENLKAINGELLD